MGRKVARVDLSIAKIAERQHGVVSVWQLYRLGIGERWVRTHVDAGRLHRIHRGVYAVGHSALSPEGRWLAAVLAVGWKRVEVSDSVLMRWGAAVSHQSAACLWKLLPVRSHPVDVIVRDTGGRAKRRGIRVHRSDTLLPVEVTLRRRIPVTTPARTISDLRRALSEGWPGALPPRALRRAIRQADVLRLSIADRDAIGGGPGDNRTRSDLELDFLRLCRRHRLPPPEVNVPVGPYLVDCLWRDRRLIVETDGYLYHRGRVAFQDDRSRDLDLKSLGYEVVRLSERQINEEESKVAQALAAFLGAG